MKLPTRRVVTAFLEHRGKILVLLRSHRIGTYPGYWAGVSGTVEFPEDVQVYVEIFEETGLTAGDLTLVQKGRPMSTRDPSLGVRWIITPYLFHAKTNRVRLNSENIGYRWVWPRDLDSLRTPPRFVDGFRRVYPPYAGIPPRTARKSRRTVEFMARDRHHGAAELAHEAAALIRSIPQRQVEWRKTAAATLSAARPLMPGIGVAVRSMVRQGSHPRRATLRRGRARRAGGTRSATDGSGGCLSIGRDGARPSKSVIRRAYPSHDTLPSQLKNAKAILTHSYSSTVLDALRTLRPREVFATDSYPLGEGRRTQAKLRVQGIRVHRVPDRNIDVVLRKVDAVLVGADAALTGEGIINKVGTRQLARSARRRGVPVFVVCGTEKRMRGLSGRLDFPLALRALDPEGYFEFCPMKFLTQICYV